MLRSGTAGCQVLLLLLSVLFIFGCDNPTGVGDELIDETGGEPTVVTLEPESTASAELAGITGNRRRFLAGTVQDPVFGGVDADGFVDFIGVGTSDEFQNGSVTSATLQLPVGYLYGDTLSSLTLELNDMSDEFESQGVSSDTTLAAGQRINLTGNEATFQASDSLLRVQLPADWIARHDSTLRSDNFTNSFHGFKVDVSGGNTVTGFSAGATFLEVVSGGDTTSFPVAAQGTIVGKTATTLSRTSAPSAPADRLPLQLFVGPTASYSFTLPDSLLQSALNRTTFIVASDTADTSPPNFRRPHVERLILAGVTDDGSEVGLAAASRSSDGRFTFRSAGLNNRLQDQIFGEVPPFAHYKLLAAGDVEPNLNTLLLHEPGADPGQAAAQLILTVTTLE